MQNRNSAIAVGRQWLTVLAVLIAIAINGLSNVYPPAGKNTGEVSNTILGGVLVTPAGYAFAIWGLIYLGLVAYSIYQVLPQHRYNRTFAPVSWALIGACILQMIWIYLFLTFQFWPSVLFMLGIAACLAFGYVHTRTLRPTWQTRWLFQAPISIYFAWITVASVLNVAGALYAMNSAPDAAGNITNPLDLSTIAVAATVVMMIVSAGLAATVALKYQDASYPAVAVWALIGIAVRNSGLAPIALTGAVLAGGLCILIVRIKASSLSEEL